MHQPDTLPTPERRQPGREATAPAEEEGPPPRPLALATLAAAVAALLLSRLAGGPWLDLSFRLMAGILFAVAAALGLFTASRHLRLAGAREAALSLAEEEPVAVLVADPQGRVLGLNTAAAAGGFRRARLAEALGTRLRDPEGQVALLLADALERGWASGTARTRSGHARLSVRRLGPGLFLWRIDTEPEPSATLPLLRLDGEGRVLAANEAYRRQFGTEPDTLAALLLDPPLRPGRVHRLAAPSGPEEHLLAEVAGEDGRRDLLILPAPAPGIPGPAGGWDAMEVLPVPLLRLSPEGLILSANSSARALLRGPMGASTRLSDMLEGLGRPVSEWVADVAAGRPTPGPQFLRGRGEHLDTVLRLSLSPLGEAQERQLIAVVDDVTELKALEAQFVQSQKMQALGQLAGGVAHDFNNLLTAISGHCDLMLLRHDQGDPEYADLVQIRQNVNRAAALVGQLLAFSRKQSMMPETLDLRVVLSDLTHLLNRLVGEKVRLTLDHDPTLRWVRADKRQLEQVIMNLVVNSRDAMPEGGEIRIETGNRRLEAPMTLGRATVPAGTYVLVRVIDKGTGIPPERLPMIFDPFYTTKRPGEGTGLGLSTVYGIIKQSGGYVFADSEVGRGTTFSLWFPAHDRAPSAATGAPAPRTVDAPGPRAATGRVLLVEDEAPVRAFAVRALRLRGHHVIEANCASAALHLLEEPGTEVDLILTDVILPDLDGPTWVRRALELRPGLRVIFVSGYAEEAFGEQKTQIEGSVFLPKPYSLTELTAVVERLLAAPDGSGLG